MASVLGAEPQPRRIIFIEQPRPTRCRHSESTDASGESDPHRSWHIEERQPESVITMKFFVYENWVRDRGRIHKAECSFCNFGQGRDGKWSNRSGKWHGPFDNRDEAFNAANLLGRREMAPCAVCDP